MTRHPRPAFIQAPVELWQAVDALVKKYGIIQTIDALAVAADRQTDRAYNKGAGPAGDDYLKTRDALDRLRIKVSKAIQIYEGY